jgi:uncharacterized alpha-E superfamily protein
MLSRHAEDLFWIGRYLERAEDTARLLDVTYHGALEAGSGRTSADLWSELLEMLFLEDEIAETPGEVLGNLLIGDRTHPGSIASIVARARENARTTREWLSSEVFETLNELHLRLGSVGWGRGSSSPYDILRSVKSGCHAVIGAAESSMPRGEGHRFLVLGQRLERAMVTARVLTVWHRRLGGFTTSAAFAEWVKLLRSVSAYEAYLREHQASMEGGRVLQFLLQSPTFPRSVLRSMSMVEEVLVALADERAGQASRRRAGRLRSEVEFVDTQSLDLATLGPFLERVEAGLLKLTTDVEHDYFRPGSSLVMHSFEVF